MRTSTDIEQAIATAHEAAEGATVSIGRSSRGSGWVVGRGRVLTNAHNLRDRTTQVGFSDGRSAQGSVTGLDTARDLAVLEVDTGDLEPLRFADAPVGVGTLVVAAARGARGARTTVGFVSSVARSFRGPDARVIDDGLEHTAPMGRGSSGGPLLDGTGAVVGINTHRLGGGFYVAQPVDAELRRTIDSLGRGEQPARAELGVAVAPPEVARRLRRSVGLEPRVGVLVREVHPDGAAERAGLAEGDLVVRAGEVELASVDALHRVLAAHDPDQPLELVVVRGDQERTVTVRFGAVPA